MSLSRSSSLGAVCGVVGVAAQTAGSGFSCALRLLQLVQSHLVLRRRCLLELVILPLLCLACLGLCSVRWIPALVGVSVARPVVGSTGEMCHRWRSPSPVLSSRRPGSTTGLPQGFEVMDQVFFRPLLVAPLLEAHQHGSTASAVDCCLSSLWAGVCSLLWQWRISARVLMVACLPLLRVGGTAPSPVPLMHRPVSGQSWPILDFTLGEFPAGLCRFLLPSPLGACRSTL